MPRPTTHTRNAKLNPAAQLTLRLHSLLHTVRSIAQVEDDLCTLLHDVERTGALAPESSAELHILLNKLPAHEYAEDLEAVRSSLGVPAAVRKPAARKKPSQRSERKSVSAKATAAKPKARKAKS